MTYSRKMISLAAAMGLAGAALAVPQPSARKSADREPPQEPRREPIRKPHQGEREMARRRRQMERLKK